MPIISWPTLTAQSQAFQASLSQLVQLRRISKDFQIMPNPLPLYNVGLRDLMLWGDATAAAKLVSWRYFANGDSADTVIAGDVNLSLQPRVVSLSYGAPVWRALQVSDAIHPDVPDMTTALYEPCLLRVPGLYVEAYWMKMLAPGAAALQTGWIIPYHMFQLAGGPLAKMYSMQDFNAQLMRFAAAQLTTPPPAAKLR